MNRISASTVPARRRGLSERLRCLAVRVGKLVRTAHSGSVPF